MVSGTSRGPRKEPGGDWGRWPYAQAHRDATRTLRLCYPQTAASCCGSKEEAGFTELVQPSDQHSNLVDTNQREWFCVCHLHKPAVSVFINPLLPLLWEPMRWVPDSNSKRCYRNFCFALWSRFSLLWDRVVLICSNLDHDGTLERTVGF